MSDDEYVSLSRSHGEDQAIGGQETVSDSSDSGTTASTSLTSSTGSETGRKRDESGHEDEREFCPEVSTSEWKATDLHEC